MIDKIKNIIQIANEKKCNIYIKLNNESWETCNDDLLILGLKRKCNYIYNEKNILIDKILYKNKWFNLEIIYNKATKKDIKIKEKLYKRN